MVSRDPELVPRIDIEARSRYFDVSRIASANWRKSSGVLDESMILVVIWKSYSREHTKNPPLHWLVHTAVGTNTSEKLHEGL